MLYLILIFTIPEDKPDDGYDETAESEPIAHGAQLESLLGNEKERSADGGHEQSRNERHPERLLLINQIDGDGPQGEDRQGLVRPSEVLPNGVETIRITHLPHQHSEAKQEHGDTDDKTLGNGTLVKLQPFSHNQTGRTESGIARRDGSCNNAQHGKNSTCYAQPVVAYQIDNSGC